MSRNPTIPPWDPELEREALGLALLSAPIPPDATEALFFGGYHPLIFRAVQALSKRGNANMLVRVARLLRSKGYLYSKERHGSDRHGRGYLVSSVDLAEMVVEAQAARRWGWDDPWARLKELAAARAMLDELARIEVARKAPRSAGRKAAG